MVIFTQFLLRLSFGLAVGMGITSSRVVASGFYRNHLYVTLGLTTLATLVALSAGSTWWPAMGAAVVSYVGSVGWLYEKPKLGTAAIWLVAVLALLGAWSIPLVSPTAGTATPWAHLLRAASVPSGGLVLGVTTAAMLLGHWYLNAPGMRLEPLQRLLLVAAAAVAIHTLVIGSGLIAEFRLAGGLDATSGWFVLLRWAFGVFGTLGLLWMAWQTLQVPNTQSATGILYVAVISVFAGELAGLLLSARSLFPL